MARYESSTSPVSTRPKLRIPEPEDIKIIDFLKSSPVLSVDPPLDGLLVLLPTFWNMEMLRERIAELQEHWTRREIELISSMRKAGAFWDQISKMLDVPRPSKTIQKIYQGEWTEKDLVRLLFFTSLAGDRMNTFDLSGMSSDKGGKTHMQIPACLYQALQKRNTLIQSCETEWPNIQASVDGLSYAELEYYNLIDDHVPPWNMSELESKHDALKGRHWNSAELAILWRYGGPGENRNFPFISGALSSAGYKRSIKSCQVRLERLENMHKRLKSSMWRNAQRASMAAGISLDKKVFDDRVQEAFGLKLAKIDRKRRIDEQEANPLSFDDAGEIVLSDMSRFDCAIRRIMATENRSPERALAFWLSQNEGLFKSKK